MMPNKMKNQSIRKRKTRKRKKTRKNQTRTILMNSRLTKSSCPFNLANPTSKTKAFQIPLKFTPNLQWTTSKSKKLAKAVKSSARESSLLKSKILWILSSISWIFLETTSLNNLSKSCHTRKNPENTDLPWMERPNKSSSNGIITNPATLSNLLQSTSFTTT